MDRWDYLSIGRVLGGIVGFLTFAGCWIYCISHYGFLVGVSLGWIPSGIAGGVVGGLVVYLWGPVVAGAVALGLYVNSQNQAETVTADPWEQFSVDANGIAQTAADAAVDANAAATDAAVAAADAAAGYGPLDANAAAIDAAATAANAAANYYPPQALQPPSVGPYESLRGSGECIDDCSGHEAGFQWAEENNVTDPENCGGRSDSFIAGCQAYAEEN